MNLNVLLIITLCFAVVSFPEIHAQETQQHENNIGKIVRAQKAPVIDGRVEKVWKTAQVHKIDNLIDGKSSGDKDISGTWKALWTSTHMFLLIEVTDDKKLMDSPKHGYLDDQIEIFLTSDNKKPANYWNPPNNNTFAYENPRDAASFENHKKKKGHVEQKMETKTGWQMEISIPFSDLNITPQAGDSIGIDIQVNDDDVGNDDGARDAKIAWNSLTDVKGGVAFNPLLQGTAVFVDSKK